MALLSYTQDATISGFFELTPQLFEPYIYDLATAVLDPQPNFRYYFVPGGNHTFLLAPSPISSKGVGLINWLGQFITDNPGWATVKP